MRPPFAFPVPPPRHLLLSALLLVAACSVEAQVGERTRGTTPEGVPMLDVLFVIDDSGSMAEEQASLAANFPTFMDELAELETGLPDLQVGVVSSDLGLSATSGSASYEITGCTGDGDDGILHGAGSDERCAGITLDGNYLVSHVTELGRVNNFTGELSDAFACVAALGTAGCGLEQHLSSMRRALDSNPQNAGFLRPDAFLAVVIIADEDDCSAATTDVFNPDDTGTIPLSSFRCTANGVTCGGGPPMSPGTYADCQPRAEASLHHPRHFVDFLYALKDDPSKIVVSVIAGNTEPFEVTMNPSGNLELAPSCDTALGAAAPATRLAWFAQQFGEYGSFNTICADDLSPAIAAIGGAVRNRIQEWHPQRDDVVYTSACAAAPGRTAARALPAALLLSALLVSSRFRRRNRS